MDIPSGVPYIICAVTKILNIFCIVRVRLVHVITLTFINAIESEGPGENHKPAASYLQTLSHKVASSTPHHEQDSNSQLYFNIFLHVYQDVFKPICDFAVP